MKRFLLIATLFTAGFITSAQAEEKTIDFNYKEAEIAKVLKDYAQASGQRFIVDPTVKGKITIINPSRIPLTEAFNQLSTALATNGIGYTFNDGIYSLKQARSIQRDAIPVVTEVPPMRPERMVTWIISLKHISADEVNKQLRILTSRDGELVPYTQTNQLLVSDWTPNLNRIAQIVKNLDVPSAKAPVQNKKTQ